MQQASEETFYNIKRLHAWFAFSALSLLGVTVWLVVADHGREWKEYQRVFLDKIQPWATEAEIRAQQTESYCDREAKLIEALNKAAREVPDQEAVERFLAQLRRGPAEADAEEIQRAYRRLQAAPGAEARRRFLERVDEAVAAAQLAEQAAQRRLRAARAEFNALRSRYEVAAGHNRPDAELARLKRRLAQIKQQVEQLDDRYQQASLQRQQLLAIRGEMTAAENAARHALAEHRRRLDALRRALARQRPNWGKRLLRLPLIEAFGQPLRIRQIWLPELTIDYNFRPVARTDRCTTCHLGIDQLAPGGGDEPRFVPLHTRTIRLAAPDRSGPAARADLEARYGFSLAPRGILEADALTVGLVVPRSPAARAGLAVGDVIIEVDGAGIASDDELWQKLAAGPGPDGVFRLRVRRGLPQPYCSHPRLDLFVGPHSPHPVERFGCTVCHDGQGSATAFRFASHTPDDPQQRRRWQDRYDWFFNRHWPFPMLPRRLSEARCLRCHHHVTDLEPSDRYPDAPAPKLVSGYHLVRQLGCFGCHEIRGFTETGQRVGPDLRLEPNYHEAALQLLAAGQLTGGQRQLAARVAHRPWDVEARRELVQTLISDQVEGLLGSQRRRLVELLAREDDPPGTMRKVGPSLRHVAQRLDARVLEAWIRDPAALQPHTRMPTFYGLHDHLESSTRQETKRLEGAEIHCIAEYLLAASQPVAIQGPPAEVTEPPSAERGKRWFQLHGCLACHRHRDFPEAQSTFAPDLSDLGSRFTAPGAREWLASWIRNPAGHRPRTRMPNPLLEPVPLEDETTETAAAPAGARPPRPMADPAADIAEYLLSRRGRQVPPREQVAVEAIDQLALMHLARQVPEPLARQYLKRGIPPSEAEQLGADAAELIEPITREKKVRYVARRTIRMRGCFGCHDIPGLEDARPIGPPLGDWGRKHESLLAFEQVHRLVEDSEPPPADRRGAFFREALLAHRREGFVWQKLRAPRSFDYKKAENKSYLERLTMGRFQLDDLQREAIVTFVLALVADPPGQRYVYRLDRRQRAIIEGRKILDRYGCAECHVLGLERWEIEYDPELFEEPIAMPEFEFLKPRFSADQLARSAQTDDRGLARARLVGMPRLDPTGQLLEDVDEEDNPLYFFGLWEPAAINGQVWMVGGPEVPVALPQIRRKWPAWGGRLARLLYPVVLEEAWAAGSTATDLEAWGWLPPPLVREGRRVQPEWLYRYLLDPYPIRPAAVLRMPKYNLSPGEAAQLVEYFTAAAGIAFPFAPNTLEPGEPSRTPGQLSQRRRQALRVLTDRTTFCAKCHLIGDYTPGDQVRTSLAPRLDRVAGRLRPDALRRWLANPKSVFPYTSMPVNFPPEGPPLGQDLLPGTSVEQIDAMVDLLLHYPEYIGSQISIRQLVESSAQRAGASADR